MKFDKNRITISVGALILIMISISLINSITNMKESLETMEQENIIVVEKLNDTINKLEHEVKVLTESNVDLENTVAKLELEKKKLTKQVEVSTMPSRSSTRTVVESKSKKGISSSQGNKTSLGSFQATAYCSCTKCCGPNSKGITATGTKVRANRTIAVDPNVIPLGSRVIINGQEYVAEDVGGAIKGKIVDIYFNSHSEALKFGRQKVDVKIIK